MLHHLLKSYAEKDNLYIQGNASLRDLVKLMHINQKGVVVVLKDKSPIGILTERDIIEILYKNIKLDEKAYKYSTKRLISTMYVVKWFWTTEPNTQATGL